MVSAFSKILICISAFGVLSCSLLVNSPPVPPVLITSASAPPCRLVGSTFVEEHGVLSHDEIVFLLAVKAKENRANVISQYENIGAIHEAKAYHCDDLSSINGYPPLQFKIEEVEKKLFCSMVTALWFKEYNILE